MTTAPSERRPLRVLFSMGNFWYVRLFESVVRELTTRGHSVHLLGSGEGNKPDKQWTGVATALAAESDLITMEWAPRSIEGEWVDLRQLVHLGLDYLRFREPVYRNTPVLAARARVRTPEPMLRIAESPWLDWTGGRRLLRGVLRTMERAIPIEREIADAVLRHQPDVVLVTPLITLGSGQHDVVRIARERGVPSVLCVGSWDHLSSKALIRERPDRVFVWNDTQRREAQEYHDVPPDRVVVTGAQCFDQWFERAPTLSREDFCRKVGLDPSRPYVLWVCSALFEGSPSEAEFVARWISTLRNSGDPRLRDVGVLVRPHPKRGFEWDTVDISHHSQVAFWPKVAQAPFGEDAKADYFDSMFHSAVVSGLNTSAQIEAGIIGRPVHTVLLPEFRSNQEETIHFHYLLDGGLLRAATDLPSHLEQLAASLDDAAAGQRLNRDFVERFVRPRGLQQAATPFFADMVESIAGAGVAPKPEPRWVPVARRALSRLARRTYGTIAHQAHREVRRREKRVERQAEREAAAARRLAAGLAIREARTAARLAARQERLMAKRRAQDAAKALRKDGA